MAKNKIRALLDQASQSDVFYCIENKTTFAEAQAAFRAGKKLFYIQQATSGEVLSIIPLETAESNMFQFVDPNLLGVPVEDLIYCITLTSEGWTTKEVAGVLPYDSTNTKRGCVPILQQGGAYELGKITPTASAYTMTSSGWSNGTYSFEATYPVASNNISIELAGTATDAQIKAWTNAKILGSATANAAVAKGTVPTIDLPIIITVMPK